MELNNYLVTNTEPLARRENIVEYKNYRVTVLTSKLYRVEFCDEKTFTDKATQKVFFRNHQKVDFRIKKNKHSLSIETGDSVLVLTGMSRKVCK